MKTAVPKYHDEQNTLNIESFYHIAVSSDLVPWMFSRHCHSDFLEISLIVDGEGNFECDHDQFIVTKGDLIIKNAGSLHSEHATSQCFEQYCLGLSGVQNPGMPSNTLLPAGVSPVIRTCEAFDYLCASTKFLFYLCNGLEIKTTEVVHQAIEYELSVINMLVADEMERVERKKYSNLVTSVLEYIDTHFGEPLSLNSIAKNFFVSSYYLAHKFKSETGYTMKQYIINRRLGEAQSLLVFNDVPIKDIASICGFSNLQHFYSVFRKYVGNTPNELRNYYKTIKAKDINI